MHMKELLLILLMLPIFSYGQGTRKGDFGIKVSYNIYPGVRIFPEVGPDIMESRVAGGFLFGAGYQWYKKKRTSIEVSIVGGLEPSLRTISLDWDKLHSLIQVDNYSSKSWYLLNEKQPVIYFNFSYKYFLSLKPNSWYLHIGGQLISPVGTKNTDKIIYEYVDDNSLKRGYILKNSQNHNLPFRPFYLGITGGIGYHMTTRFLNFDYKLKLSHFQPYYHGVYETYPDAPFYAKGTYIQSSYKIEFGISFFIRSFKKNKTKGEPNINNSLR